MNGIAGGAFVSVDNIVDAYMLRRGMHPNTWWKVLPLAAEAVRELGLTSGLMVQHTILKKNEPDNSVSPPIIPDNSWFTLPADFTDYISVGIRQGDMWRPIAVDSQLMPYPKSDGSAEFTPTEHTDEFNIDGAGWKKWLNPKCCSLDNAGEYGYLFPFEWWGYWSDHVNDYGEFTGRYFGFGDGQRVDVCYINPQRNIIMVPNCFCNEIYLVYIAVGKVDTMTHIDVRAQSAIEAYIDWKYAANRKAGLIKMGNTVINQGAALKLEWQNQHAIYRARKNDLGITELHRILASNYGVTQRMR